MSGLSHPPAHLPPFPPPLPAHADFTMSSSFLIPAGLKPSLVLRASPDESVHLGDPLDFLNASFESDVPFPPPLLGGQDAPVASLTKSLESIGIKS
eukprot:CAMPEP_0172068672 /NCGR_PEP_ID=MMETSP1043-20130122/12334_1 /TAXON_ID=464988 /ORGANISM="Hemiselmis andersenii, Strain CCMP441" /LENGTH=95 /DNA_ID=CAMNT_0012728943 /DNA_START=63 /DNA_END=350 /DNA_ORIENTATION=-